MAEEYKVEMTPKAEDDLDHILRYLLSIYSREAVENALFAIREKASSLSRFPHSKPIFHTTRKRSIEYRYTVAKKVHRLVFNIEEENNMIFIARIVHVRADTKPIKNSLEEE